MSEYEPRAQTLFGDEARRVLAFRDAIFTVIRDFAQSNADAGLSLNLSHNAASSVLAEALGRQFHIGRLCGFGAMQEQFELGVIHALRRGVAEAERLSRAAAN